MLGFTLPLKEMVAHVERRLARRSSLASATLRHQRSLAQIIAVEFEQVEAEKPASAEQVTEKLRVYNQTRGRHHQ